MEINPLLSPDSSSKFGEYFTKGKLEDVSLILKAAKEAEEKLTSTELMQNLALLYYYAPSLPDIIIVCNQLMVDLANKCEPALGGSSAYKIIYMLYQSQLDEKQKIRSDAREEIIRDIMNRFDVLVGNDRKIAQDLRTKFSIEIKGKGFSACEFPEEWDPVSDPDE